MFYITATGYYLLLSVLRMSSTRTVINNSFSKNTTVEQLNLSVPSWRSTFRNAFQVTVKL